MPNYKLLAKLRGEVRTADVVSLRPHSDITWSGLSCIIPASRSPDQVVSSIEDRVEEASSIVRGLIETATTRAEQADLLRVFELLRS